MTTNPVNSNQFNEVFLQNSSRQENGTKVDTQYRNCIFELNDDNGIIERSDMKDDLEYENVATGREIYEKIQNFFTNNGGKNWTIALKDEIVNLIKQFNNISAEEINEKYDEQDNNIYWNHKNMSGQLTAEANLEYDNNKHMISSVSTYLDTKSGRMLLNTDVKRVQNSDGTWTQTTTLQDGTINVVTGTFDSNGNFRKNGTGQFFKNDK